MKTRHARLRLESLEAREVPATLVSPTKLTYQDADGDAVTVSFSRPILNSSNVNSVFTFSTGAGAVNGSNAAKEQLRKIDLTMASGAAGTNLAVSAARSKATGGDGHAAIGEVNALLIDLAQVRISGDLGRITAGDGDPAAPGVKGLAVQSLGRFGTVTGAADLHTTVNGRLAALTVRSDVNNAFVYVKGNIGPVSIGGSLLATGFLANQGRIYATENIGKVSIKGDIVGSSGQYSGALDAPGSIARVTVGGSVRGGSGDSSGLISSGGDLGPVTIGGGLIGGAGAGSGLVDVFGKLASVTVGGWLEGGAGTESGSIVNGAGMGAIKVGGNLIGGSGFISGSVFTSGPVASLKVGGSMVGGTNDDSGSLVTGGGVGTVQIKGDIRGGSATGSADLTLSGSIQADRIAKLTVGGSLIAGTNATSGTYLNNGSIRAKHDLVTVLIKGSVVGNVFNAAIISAAGSASPTATKDVAIGSLTVLGRVEEALIQAGVNVSGTAANADAQIGKVKIGGDFIRSDLVAGVTAGMNATFGDNDDAKLSGGGVKDTGVVSRIDSVRLGGEVIGSGIDTHGIVAENIGSLKIGKTAVTLSAGNGNDDVQLTVFGSVKAREV